MIVIRLPDTSILLWTLSFCNKKERNVKIKNQHFSRTKICIKYNFRFPLIKHSNVTFLLALSFLKCLYSSINMYIIRCWVEISYLVVPLYLRYRLYPRFATEGDVITSVHFHPFTGDYTYLRLFVMNRWWYLRPFRSNIHSLRVRR